VDHREKVRLAIAELKARKGGYRLPPLYRLVLRLGLYLPPPPFWGFWMHAVSTAVMFGIMYGALSLLLRGIWDRPMLRWWELSCMSVLFGLATAAFERRRRDLPRWRDYRPVPPGTFD
jgi:hypothetical protein